MDSNRIYSEGHEYRCVYTCWYRHSLTHTHAHTVFSLKQHRGLGGISWMGAFQKKLYYFEDPLWGDCGPFILKRTHFNFFMQFPISLLSLLPFTSGVLWDFSISTPCLYGWKEKQMTVQIEKEVDIKHLMAGICLFFSFLRSTQSTKRLGLHATCVWKLLIFTIPPKKNPVYPTFNYPIFVCVLERQNAETCKSNYGTAPHYLRINS